MNRLSKLPVISALCGGALWLTLLSVRIEVYETELIQKVLLLGVLVIVPIGLWLVATPKRNSEHSLPYRLAVLTQPFGAAAVVCSFLIEPGFSAAALASLWLIVVALIGLFGLWRFLSRGVGPAEEFCIDAGLIYLTVGGVWLTMARLGSQPLGFGDTIVLLTAVHFHFAGFAAPILAGLAGRVPAGARGGRTLLCLAATGIITGIPLVAAGITSSPALALAGAIVISLGLVSLAVFVLKRVVRSRYSLSARLLLVVSSLSSVAAMVLACLYAYSIVVKQLWLDIPLMAMTHGIINAFGFTLCGLLAWTIIKPKPRSAVPGIPFSKLSSKGFTGADYFERVGARSAAKPQPLGLVDKFAVYRREDFDTNAVHPLVRSFYEETYRYRLIVRPHWKRGFRLGGRFAFLLGTWAGQLRLPIASESRQDKIESRLIPVDDEFDGRDGVRGWVRTYFGTDRAMYVAAYAAHSFMGSTYMNIAFPLPGGNLSSILHVGPASTGVVLGGVTLSTLTASNPAGDQGVYYANRVTPIRLPLNETITVWPIAAGDSAASAGEQPMMKARHQMWLCGINFLNLDYDIFAIAAE